MISKPQEEFECRFCGSDYADDIDEINQGWWCADCDSYNYFDQKEEENRKFTLILESKSSVDNARQAVKVRLNKRLSPLIYPGGKGKIADFLYHRLSKSKTKSLTSPYCGGASTELALLHANVIERLVLNDFDYGVYALFQTIKEDPEALIRRIRNFVPTHDDYFKAQEIIKADYQNCGLLDAAFNLLLNNRLAYSGIYYANPRGGKHGDHSELLCRWNTENLIKRLKTIHEMGHKITVHNMDACELIEEEYWNHESTLLIDPPYYKQGKYLYRCFYEKEDHIKLNFVLESLYSGFPGADILLCYDDEEFIERLYWFPQVEKISRAFSA